MKIFNKKRESGQAAVEFAILLPILLILICGILDFGWMFYCRLTLSNATRECTRYAALHCYEFAMEDDLLDVLEEKFENETRGIFDNDGSLHDPAIVPVNSGENYVVTCEADMRILTPVLGTINGGSKYKELSDEFTMRIESLPNSEAVTTVDT